MLRLKRLKIVRYRHVASGSEIRFGDGFNVLLGMNAVGKTTLLNLIAALTNHDLSLLKDDEDGFDLDYDLEPQPGKLIRLRVTRTRRSDERPRASILGSAMEPQFTEHASLDLIGMSEPFQSIFADGKWSHLPPQDAQTSMFGPVWLLRALVAERPKKILESAVEELWPLVTGSCPRFDESTKFLDGVLRNGAVMLQYGANSGMGAWPHQEGVPLEVALQAKEVFQEYAASSRTVGELLVPLSLGNEGAKESAGASLLGFDHITLSMRVKKQEAQGTSTSITYADFAFRFELATQTKDSSAPKKTIIYDYLSFGQKRLFGFLWYCRCRTGLPVVADELANGMHHGWIRACVDLLIERQSFLATQHPFLIDYLPNEAVFISCQLDADGQMAWSNFAPEQNERLVQGRARGVMQLSELLQTEGLW
jgi:energy-coupling factor transporter ATP-binding protein EcfA2